MPTRGIGGGASRNLRPVIIAALAAGFLMLGSNLTYRALAARLAAPASARPIAPEVLSGFPLQIGDWVGQDVPLDPAIVVRTDTDAHVNRGYSRAGGLESVGLYVACGVKVRDLAPHRPEVCYTGNGWTLAGRRLLECPSKDGPPLTCRLFTFSRGTLGAEKIVVLYYYIVDGRTCHDVSVLRFNFWRIGYVAQVQIAALVTEAMTTESATALVSDFVVEAAPRIAGLFERIADDRAADSSRPGDKEE